MGLTGTAQGLSDDLGWFLGPDERVGFWFQWSI